VNDKKPTRGRYVFGTNTAPALFGEPEPHTVEGRIRYFTAAGEEVSMDADGGYTFKPGDYPLHVTFPGLRGWTPH